MVNLKLKVNENEYEIEIEGENVIVNNIMMNLKIQENSIILGDNTYYLDFLDESEPSLMIVNGASYIVSKNILDYKLNKEIRSPINGKITDLLVNVSDPVKNGQTILILEAMKMENQIKSHLNGVIKKIFVAKNQLVKKGDNLVTFQ
jgi:biotin carboxyl carrier protein